MEFVWKDVWPGVSMNRNGGSLAETITRENRKEWKGVERRGKERGGLGTVVVVAV